MGGGRGLEAFNGTWAILAGQAFIWLVIHLVATGERAHLSWRRWLFDLPLGMQIAVATAVISAGVFLSRLAVWVWRFFLGAAPDRLYEIDELLILGAITGSVGFLCLIRVVTRPRGHWPLAVAIGSVLAYLGTFL